MTGRAKSDQIFCRIISRMATVFFVVDLKIRHAAARLASPTIPAEDQFAEMIVRIAIQTLPR